MSLCWPLQMPPTPKAVLISLADNANDQGVCWPSIATISERTCFSERAVQNAIKWLESVGALRADRSNGRHTSYTVTPKEYRQPPQEMHPAGDAPPQQVHHTPAGDAPDPRSRCVGPPQEVPTNRKEPSLEPSGNRKGKERDDLIGVSGLVADGVDAQHAKDWLTLRKAKKLPLTPSAWAMTKNEAAKVGLSPAQAVADAVGENWAGFKAEWWKRAKGIQQSVRASPLSRQSESDRRINEFLSGSLPDDGKTIDMETIR